LTRPSTLRFMRSARTRIGHNPSAVTTPMGTADKDIVELAKAASAAHETLSGGGDLSEVERQILAARWITTIDTVASLQAVSPLARRCKAGLLLAVANRLPQSHPTFHHIALSIAGDILLSDDG
jgi:hypothetical protein